MTTIAMGPGGEFDRIRAIADALGGAASGLGDDTAVLPDGDGAIIVTNDACVEGVHYRPGWLRDEEIGWRAAAAALSDLAAAGATPVGVLVGMTIPAGIRDERPVGVMRGVGEMVRSAGTVVRGGNLSDGPVMSLTTTAIGRSRRPMSRVGARVGDGVWVSGVLGGARAALLAWLDGREPAAGARTAFARPQPRLRAGTWLATHGATSMMDVSDGLAGDAPHLASASGVRIDIDLATLPIHPSVHGEARRRDEPAAVLAAVGGEDYELLFTMPDTFDDAAGAEAGGGVPITRIGTVLEGAGVRFRLGEQEFELEGFRHR